MGKNRLETKLLFQELNENPYKQFNNTFLLISVIPLLAVTYLFFDKIFHQSLPQST